MLEVQRRSCRDFLSVQRGKTRVCESQAFGIPLLGIYTHHTSLPTDNPQLLHAGQPTFLPSVLSESVQNLAGVLCTCHVSHYSPKPNHFSLEGIVVKNDFGVLTCYTSIEFSFLSIYLFYICSHLSCNYSLPIVSLAVTITIDGEN